MSWSNFSQSDVKIGTGSFESVAIGPVKVPKIGQVFGIRGEPDCDGTGYEVGLYLEWGSGKGFRGWPLTKEVPGANCRDLVVGFPENSVVVGLKFYGSDSKGRNYREYGHLRNVVSEAKFDWASRQQVRTRAIAGRRDLMVRCKNWRRSYSRYFGFEVLFQLRHRYQAHEQLLPYKIDIYHDEASEEKAEQVLATLEEHGVGDTVTASVRDVAFLTQISMPKSDIEVRFSSEEDKPASALTEFLNVELEDVLQFDPRLLSGNSTPGVISILMFSEESRNA